MDLRLEFQEQRPETHDHDDDFPCVIHYLPNGLLLKYHHGATPAISFFFFFFYCLSTYRPYSILYEFHCLAFETNKTTQKKKKTNGKIKEEEGEKGRRGKKKCVLGSVLFWVCLTRPADATSRYPRCGFWSLDHLPGGLFHVWLSLSNRSHSSLAAQFYTLY